MTATELYDCDSTFRALIDVWVEGRRCPLVLVDLLLELGMESQAECARWCALEPNYKVEAPFITRGERDGYCGPYPTLVTGGNWVFVERKFLAWDSPHRVRGIQKTIERPSPLKTILMYMDAFDPKLVPAPTNDHS